MATVYMIPTVLHEEGMTGIPAYVLPTIKECAVFFVENERTARRYLKALDKSIVIDDYEWFTMSGEQAIIHAFRQKIKEGKTIGIISEAGCPGVADPGQLFAGIAQQLNATIKPLVGPNSVLLALMASGMNGQQFQFVGYLPIDNQQRMKKIKELEAESEKKNCTQIFIETPYRNNQLLETLLKSCRPSTKVCIAVDITAPAEWIKTKTAAEWQKENVDIHKRPAIFLLYAGQ